MSRVLILLVLLLRSGIVYGADEVTDLPKGTFKIIQHYDGHWAQVLQFTQTPVCAICLEGGTSRPALYYVSPDEEWVLRIQKSGAGDNISWLYHLDAQHSIWRMEEQIGALGFAYLAQQPDLSHDLYHTGIAFGSWDIKTGLLRFNIRGSNIKQSSHCINQSLSYHLRSQTITSP